MEYSNWKEATDQENVILDQWNRLTKQENMISERWKKLMEQEQKKKMPVVNIALVAVNVIVWCIMELLGDTLDGAFIAQYGGMHPKLLAGGEWYRLFTAMFVHFGAEHLANNMILLAAAGGKLETEIGHVRYFLIYIGSGLAGNLLSYEVMMRTGDFAVCAGASGAVFGMIGALVWASIRNKGKFQGLTTRGLLFMIALCLYYGITTAGVDNWAHMGGAACGFLLCLFLCKITECLKMKKKIYILCKKK